MIEPLLIVMTTLPDLQSAQTLARQLVEARLAACVQIGAPIASIYRWQGGIETAQEVPLSIKTTAARYDALERFLKQHHPYTLPEIITLRDAQGTPAYLDWVNQETLAKPLP
ncbi:MAG: divalent-cation tolerance protein CutA [Betaproteobacteria bacterium]|nr:MAG: divalent-cation tolerance protein CutA [Betaproteobacteria bacterium]